MYTLAEHPVDPSHNPVGSKALPVASLQVGHESEEPSNWLRTPKCSRKARLGRSAPLLMYVDAGSFMICQEVVSIMSAATCYLSHNAIDMLCHTGVFAELRCLICAGKMYAEMCSTMPSHTRWHQSFM